MPDEFPAQQPAAPPPPEPQADRQNALEAVKGPAVFLLVVAILGIVLAAVSLIMNLAGVGMGAAGTGDQAQLQMLSGGFGVVVAILSMIGSVVVLLGSLKMMKLESYGFAMAAAIIAMLPGISGCCILGLPAGIWALVVLLKPEVKDAFQ